MPIIQVTDAASLYDHLLKDVSWAREERTRLAILVVKEDLQQENVSLRWSPTALQLGDALTKKDSQVIPHLRALMAGRWKWHESSEERRQHSILERQ